MVTAHELLEREYEDADEPNFTEKQTSIVRETLQNPDADVDDIAEETDSHPNYVRDILTRVNYDTVGEREEFADLDIDTDPSEVPPPEEDEHDEAEVPADDEAAPPKDGENGVEPEKPEQPEMPQEEQETGESQVVLEEVDEWPEEYEEPDGDITISIEDEVPITVEANIPQDLIYRAVHHGAGIAPKPAESPHTVQLDADLVDGLVDQFDISEQRAGEMILKIGTDRARQLVGDYPEDVEEVLEELQPDN